MRKTAVVFFFVFGVILAEAQVNTVGVVDAGDDVTVSAGLPVRLEASYVAYYGNVVTVHDDDFAGPFDIGFEFVFYGDTVTQFKIGANGVVSFDLNQGAYRDPVKIPNGKMQKAIYGPYQDYFSHGSTNTATVYYKTIGEEPGRRLVVGWCEAPMYSCEDLKVSFQIVLNEDGRIENHIINKPECSYMVNKATQGLNYGFDKGVAVPGRNNSSWVATDESWEYVPAGDWEDYSVNQIDFLPEVVAPAQNISFGWVEGSYGSGSVLGSSAQVVVSPVETTVYYAVVTLCGGLKFYDDVTVNVIPLPNAFKPGSTIESNRVFRLFPDTVAGLQDFTMYVYDRWGGLVFETSDPKTGWDGTGKDGKDCAAGVYAWVIYYEKAGMKLTHKGSVTLVR